MNNNRLPRSFKVRAERLALKMRAELGLGPNDRLDPRRLALHLGIKVVELSLLVANGASRELHRALVAGSRASGACDAHMSATGGAWRACAARVAH